MHTHCGEDQICSQDRPARCLLMVSDLSTRQQALCALPKTSMMDSKFLPESRPNSGPCLHNVELSLFQQVADRVFHLSTALKMHGIGPRKHHKCPTLRSYSSLKKKADANQGKVILTYFRIQRRKGERDKRREDVLDLQLGQVKGSKPFAGAMRLECKAKNSSPASQFRHMGWLFMTEP